MGRNMGCDGHASLVNTLNTQSRVSLLLLENHVLAFARVGQVQVKADGTAIDVQVFDCLASAKVFACVRVNDAG